MPALNTIIIPSRISARIQGLIAQRDAKLAERREFREYNGFDDFTRRQNQAERVTLASAIKELESQIIQIARKYMNGMAVIVDTDIESTIANIVAALPVEPNIKQATVINARGHQVA